MQGWKMFKGKESNAQTPNQRSVLRSTVLREKLVGGMTILGLVQPIGANFSSLTKISHFTK